MKNVGIKSERIYHVSSLYGLVHEISLVCREYMSGRCIYIIKYIFSYYENGIIRKEVYKDVYRNKDNALSVLADSIRRYTLKNINDQMELI